MFTKVPKTVSCLIVFLFRAAFLNRRVDRDPVTGYERFPAGRGTLVQIYSSDHTIATIKDFVHKNVKFTNILKYFFTGRKKVQTVKN